MATRRRSRDLVGKQIAEVRFVRIQLGMGRSKVVIDALVLDDGTELRSHAYETEHEPQGDLLHVKATRKPRGR